MAIKFESINEKELNDNFDDLDFAPPKYTKAQSLPDGWQWCKYADGSGHLESPDGKSYFAYDEAPYHPDGIEYKEKEGGRYGPFWGDMEDFKSYAEEIVSERYLEKEVAKNMDAKGQPWKPERTNNVTRKSKTFEVER